MVTDVVTAPWLYSVLQKLTFLTVIVAWMIFNYHQINCSSLATGTQPIFAMGLHILQRIALIAANIARTPFNYHLVSGHLSLNIPASNGSTVRCSFCSELHPWQHLLHGPHSITTCSTVQPANSPSSTTDLWKLQTLQLIALFSATFYISCSNYCIEINK